MDTRPSIRPLGSMSHGDLPMSEAVVSIEPLKSPLFLAPPAAPTAITAARSTEPFAAPTASDDAAAQDDARDRTAPGQDALAAVQVASEAFEQLRRSGRQLHFETNDHGVLRIEVYDGTGELVRTIPPNEALALASGEASWRA